MADLSPPQEISSEDKQTQLKKLIEQAAAKDAIKDHNAASELYSQATELQAELNGELSPENADLLYAYGKSLYNVAVGRSDVLGSKVAGEPQGQSNKGSAATAAPPEQSSEGSSLIKDAISNATAKHPKPAKKADPAPETEHSKPFFQFTGDENFEEEDEDDFANAFEVLDLARILYLKKLDAAEGDGDGKDKGKSTDVPADLKHIKERLADTYDLQAEISLEGERFSDAVTDLRTALDLRYSLFPFEDASIAECHYKLSLALEFASVQQQGEDGKEKSVDKQMRKEAATQMERAIESCKVRMEQEEKKLANNESLEEDKVTATKRKIANVKEIIADMEQRVRAPPPPTFHRQQGNGVSKFVANIPPLQLVDLHRSPVSIEESNQESEAFLKGILGQIVGQPAADQKAQLDAASKGATDLSSLVRRKPANQSSPSSVVSGKRPAEDSSIEQEAKRPRGEVADDAS
ncbi:hypothetical protein N7468_010480 [Penicillium chermesinum]|uniref:Tetratricopeptide SHNi-TPR domain-containing protein n=1 Tax=Penicillium chermesinum TaxID=63820 RepID=A0A9W9N7T7_9EURO|nr:uncharacterized protein N7468_010480 [Penicillium chermesinum]KAJ5214801.1 hypothetical protein N7468_010480 [Penicillium chermesinum]